MPYDFDELMAKKRPTVIECAIALDADLAEAHADALTAYEVARKVAQDNPGQKSSQAALADAKDALEAAEAAVEGSVVTFRFQGLGRTEWDALLDEHQATKDQVRKARDNDEPAPSWNEDTFPAALVAACSIDPELTYEQAQQLWKSDTWNTKELLDLFNAAYSASRGRRVPLLGKGSGRTPS